MATWFGGLRGQFSSAQMRTRDYAQASARKQLQTLKKIESEGIHTHDAGNYEVYPNAVTEEEFASCADRALVSAVKLAACSCEFLGFPVISE